MDPVCTSCSILRDNTGFYDRKYQVHKKKKLNNCTKVMTMKTNRPPSKWKLIRLAIWITLTDPIRRKLRLFDSNGLNYTLKHLREVKRSIAYASLETQAKYVDRYTKHHSKDADFLKSSWTGLDINDPNIYRNMTATSVGNLAYMALRSHGEYAQKAKSMLQKYKDYVAASGSTTTVVSIKKIKTK